MNTPARGERPIGPTRRRPWIVLVAAAVVVGGLVIVAPPGGGGPEEDDPIAQPTIPTTTGRGSGTTTTSPATTTSSPTTTDRHPSLPEEGPIFGIGVPSDAILLFDDGLTGLFAVDPDRRLAARSQVDGQRAGDEPYSMVGVGDTLVVGWSEIFAVDVATRVATPLGNATIFVPAAENDRVWLIDWPGGAIGLGGTPEVWQVDTDGNPLGDREVLDVEGFPAIGIVGGLAIQVDDGIVLWDAATGSTTPLPGGSRGMVLDSAGSDLVWCALACVELVVTDTTTLGSERFPPPPGFSSFVISAGPFRGPQALSPDGSHLAALVRRSGIGPPFEPADGLWVLHRPTGNAVVVVDERSATTVDHVAWSPDGSHAFATSWSYGESSTTIWRYDTTTGHFASVVLPFGGMLAPVVVDEHVADAYLGEPDPDEPCVRRPADETRICTFGF